MEINSLTDKEVNMIKSIFNTGIFTNLTLVFATTLVSLCQVNPVLADREKRVVPQLFEATSEWIADEIKGVGGMH